MRIGNLTTLRSAGVLLCCSIVASGEHSSAAQSQPAQENGAEVIVIGCVVRLDDSAFRPGTTSGSRRTSSRNPPSSGFVLKDAAIVPQPTGTTGSVQTNSEREFHLVKSEFALEKFAGQQVEVKARVVAGDAPGEAAAPSTTTSGDEGGRSADKRPGAETRGPNETASMLRVTAARALSRTCPAQGGR
jgi:hypothetical protein